MFEHLKYATQLKHSDFIQNPEERQLIEEALLADQANAPFYYVVLAGLGRQLTEWGQHLQERYDQAAQMRMELPPLEKASK